MTLRHRHRLGAAVAGTLLIIPLVLWALHGQFPQGPPAKDESPRPASGAAASLMHRLEAAVRDGDPVAAAGLAVPEMTELVQTWVSNAAAMDLRGFSARYLDEVDPEPVMAGHSWAAVVELRWTLGDRDLEPVRVEVEMMFEQQVGGLAIAGLGTGPRPAPVWLQGQVHVHKRPGLVIISRTSQEQADRSARLALRGRTQVADVLSTGAGPIVVEIPASAVELESALGVPRLTYRQIAAVTTSTDGRGSPVHVFVNPEVWGALDGRARQVVMTHELVHLTTRDAERSVASWLAEGFADYVALRAVDLPDSLTAGRAARKMRREGVPDRLPTNSEFTSDSPNLQAAYESAWLACEVIAERLGEGALVAIHSDVIDGLSVAEALKSYGWSQEGLVSAWQARLQALAG